MSDAKGGSPLPETARELPDHDFQLVPHADLGAPKQEILTRLTVEIPWRQEAITLFGRTHAQPRLICWMGDPGYVYRYSGMVHKPQPWHPLVSNLRARVEELADAHFNGVLLNYYRDGNDSMGFHADDEPELGARPVIASLSFGAGRLLKLRHRQDCALPTQKLSLQDGSLLVMRGNSQRDWKHAIPKMRRIMEPRINLTFRQIRFPTII